MDSDCDYDYADIDKDYDNYNFLSWLLFIISSSEKTMSLPVHSAQNPKGAVTGKIQSLVQA